MRTTRPCLASVNLLGTPQEKGLADLMPENCFVQEIVMECCRTARSDKNVAWVGSDYCSLKVSAPSVYMTRRHIPFITPVEHPRGGYEWPRLIEVLRETDVVAASYGDAPMMSRILAKGCVLVELPLDKFRDSKDGGGPNPAKAYFRPDEPDPLYEGVRFARIFIEGTQYMAEAEYARNGWLPGATHKPLDVIEIHWLVTKHVGKDISNRTSWTAYSRNKDDVIIFDESRLIGISDKELYNLIPSLCDAGIIQMRDQEVAEYNLTRGRFRDVGLRRVRRSDLDDDL